MDVKYSKDHPRNVLPVLCRKFYDNGWMTGTGGALGLRSGEKIFMTPSGLQKEEVKPEDLFVENLEGSRIESPEPERQLKITTCRPLITNVFRLVPNCQAVYHIHNKNAVLVSLAYTGTVFRITQQKLLQVIRKSNMNECFSYYDMLEIPIIENKPREDDLEDQMKKAMGDFPQSSALIIRRHGMYVWANTWETAKVLAEAYDYLFELAIHMKQFGLDPQEVPPPPDGAYL